VRISRTGSRRKAPRSAGAARGDARRDRARGRGLSRPSEQAGTRNAAPGAIRAALHAGFSRARHWLGSQPIRSSFEARGCETVSPKFLGATPGIARLSRPSSLGKPPRENLVTFRSDATRWGRLPPRAARARSTRRSACPAARSCSRRACAFVSCPRPRGPRARRARLMRLAKPTHSSARAHPPRPRARARRLRRRARTEPKKTPPRRMR